MANSTQSFKPDIEAIRAGLRANSEAVARALLGDPTIKASRGEWRYGRKGSLAVVVSGQECGSWFSHGAGEGGDALALIMHVRRCSFVEALGWARQFLSLPEAAQKPAQLPSQPLRRPQKKDASEWSMETARDICKLRVPAAGTIVQSYIAEFRKLNWWDDLPLFFCEHAWRNSANGPHGPAMIADLTDPVTSEWRGVHVTYLRADGMGKADGPNQKITLGSGVIRLTPDEDVTTGLGICEGSETSLRVMEHFRPVWCATSATGIASFPVLHGIESLSIFADTGEAGQGAAHTCAERWAAAGREARIVTPRDDDWDTTMRSAV